MLNSSPSAPAHPQDGGNGMTMLVTFLRKLESDRYFGKVELSFQSGHVVNLRKEESLKPSDLQNLVGSPKGTNNADNKR